MSWVILAALCCCLAIGFYFGWLCRDDRMETQAYEVRHAAGRHARAAARRSLAPPDPPTDELIAIGYGGYE